MNLAPRMPDHTPASRRLAVAVVAAFVASSVAACSSAPIHASDSSTTTATFATGTPVAQIPASATGDVGYQPPAVLHDRDAYIGGNGKIDIIDIATAKTIGTIHTQHQPAPTRDTTDSRVAPGVVTDTGAPLVLWPVLVTSPDKSVAVELIAIHTDTHNADHVNVALPASFAPTQPSQTTVAVLGAVGPTVVLQFNDLLRHTAMAVDAHTGRTLWSRADFTATAVADHTVVGTEPEAAGQNTSQVTGLDITTGRPVWTQLPGTDNQVLPAGPTLVVATGRPTAKSDKNPAAHVLAAKTGAVVATLPPTLGRAPRCVYDQASVTVCTSPADPRAGGRIAVAFDANTGHTLWSMPNKDTGSGEAPFVTTAWHGYVYTAETESALLPDNTTTVTDGRSATVPLKSDQPSPVYQSRSGSKAGSIAGAVPLAVNDQGCLAIDVTHSRLVVRARTAPQGT